MRLLIAGVLLCLTSALSHAETIAIIGTGKVGIAIGSELADQGHTIVYGSRSPAGLKALEAAQQTAKDASTDTPSGAAGAAGIIVLAVPGTVAVEVAAGLGDLTGKLLIDVTNPLLVDDSRHFRYGAERSNGESIQAAQEGAVVVKALNTVPWQLMVDAKKLDAPVSVPLSGDDQEAKQLVADIVRKMGLEPIDIGGIETAYWSELTSVVLLNNRFSARPGFELYLRPTD